MKKTIVTTLILFSFVMSGTIVWGQSTDDCVFNWFETNYPEYLSPVDQPSQTIAPYSFRYYPQTQGYLGVDVRDNHLYYLGPMYAGGDTFWDLGSMTDWQLYTGCAASTGTEQEVRLLLDSVLGLTTTTVGDGLTEQVSSVLEGLINGSTPTSCPYVTSTLDIASLMNAKSLEEVLASLPSTIVASADYGEGCQIENGDMVAGNINLQISGLQINSESGAVSLSFEVDVDNLVRQDVDLGDGRLSGSLNINQLNISADMHFEQFLVANGQRLDGSISLGTQGDDIRVVMELGSGEQFQTKMDMLISEVEGEEGVYEVNSSYGSVNGYDLQFDNLVFDADACEHYPVDGAVIFTKGGDVWTAVFNPSCDGSYILQ